MSISLKDRLEEDMKVALRAGDKNRLSIIRMAVAAIKNLEIDKPGELDDSHVERVLEKMVKQSKEAISLYEQGGDQTRAAKEATEIKILMQYLPDPLKESEVAALIDEIIQATGASTRKDMGSVLGEIRVQAAGRVDMKKVSSQVRTRLTQPSSG